VKTATRKPFFFEKKKQKTSSNGRPGPLSAPSPMTQIKKSFFASFFSKKEVLSLLCMAHQ
jgi:hypothetical protein